MLLAMAKHQAYYNRFGKKKYTQIVYVILFLVAGISGLQLSGIYQPLQNQYIASVFSAYVHGDTVSSPYLSESDKKLYKQIFTAQKSGNFELADTAISKLSSDILLGDVLAERYLNSRYNASLDEITVWIKNYPDHPQAFDISELANNKHQNTVAYLPKSFKKTRLRGYGDTNNNEIRFDNNQQAKKLWAYAIEAWRTNKKEEAAKFFTSLVEKQGNLTSWQYAAANFWAYRAYHSLGEHSKASKYLKQAAVNPRVFYGIIARKQLKIPLELDTKPIILDDAEFAKLQEKPEVKRIIALSQSELNDRADTQIRQIFPSVTNQEKWGLLFLANKLGLASAQISMAKQLDSNSRQLDALKYPIPKWQPDDGFNIDPTLIYALIRQESGFRTSAISPAGALGLMQLMPQTAKKMHSSYIASNYDMPDIKSQTVKNDGGRKFSDPILNITLGEHYVSHLLTNNLINGNLFYMLAAYNAGIGRLKEWQDNIDYNEDPLLFVESIPYSETRSYVMQVMTNYWIYSELTGVNNNSIFALLRNKWPSYLPNIDSIAANSNKRNING